VQRKPVNDQADGLVVRFDPKRERDKFKGKKTKVSSIGLCHYWHEVKNLGLMQKKWSAIIVTRKDIIEIFAS
jgi:hypothetical protein